MVTYEGERDNAADRLEIMRLPLGPHLRTLHVLVSTQKPPTAGGR